MYDIIFIQSSNKENTRFDNLRKRFPLAKQASSLKEAMEKSSTTLFWIVWPDIDIADTFTFEYKVPREDRAYAHIFKKGNEYTGACIVSKNAKISDREFKHRFFLNRREIDIMSGSIPSYDIFFISYNEPNAEENWINLKTRFPRACRIHGVKGIHQAHIRAAELSDTNMFWVVDGDSVVADDFTFELLLPNHDEDIVHVWASTNPINNLEYGYGGIKLLPRQQTIAVDVTSSDMTTSISKNLRVVPTVANITKFNTDPFNTWKSAFRECVKLSSKSIQGQVDTETEERLDIWCTVASGDYSEFATTGALAGRKYGQENAGNIPALSLINNFDWLQEQFNCSQSN